MKISAVDLFCGVGGLTHGIIKSGIQVIAGIDTDVTCKYAYEVNNGASFINEDIRNIHKEDIEQLYSRDSIKLLMGCAPCQPFSKLSNKNRNRSLDEKWSLLYEFARIVDEVKPDLVSMENVPEIVRQKVFKDFIKLLENIGYSVSWEIVYCPDYGIPQSRKRLVLLASKFGQINLKPPTIQKDNYTTVRVAIGDLEKIEAGECSKNDPMHKATKLNELNMKRIEKSIPGGTWKDWDEDLLAPCHRKASGESFSFPYSRMEWDKPSPTITTQFYSYGTGRFGHPEQNRALSLREGAILQTFPPDYIFAEPGKDVYFTYIGKHIGNAVPVTLGTVIGQSIIYHIQNIRRV